MRHRVLGLCVVALAVSWMASKPAAAESRAIAPDTPWRIFVTCTRYDKRRKKPPVYSKQPAADWKDADFDDSDWPRYSDDLTEAIGGYGFDQTRDIHLIHLRTRFGVSQPSSAQDLTLALTYRGGVVAYVNGKEIGRQHLPKGKLDHKTLAEAYPREAMVRPDGKQLRKAKDRVKEFKERYDLRLRKAVFKVPASALREGSNTLAMEIHAAPSDGIRTGKHEWSAAGLCEVQLVSRSGRGIIPYEQARRKVIFSQAGALETVASKPEEYQSGFLWWGITVTPKGLTHGNPYEPLVPIRTVAPRGGTCSGQIIVSGPGPMPGVSARMGELTRVGGGGAIPQENVLVRYAVQPESNKWCDHLMEAPAANTATQPVWVIVDVPRDQRPGWYTGELTMSVAGAGATAPVQLLVSPWTVPEPDDNQTFVSMYQSPDTLAKHYKVPYWSDQHFALIEKSMRAMAYVGNDVLLVPVIVDNYLHHEHGMIRWKRSGQGYEPDFSVFERYLDLFIEVWGKPKVVTLNVWEHDFGCRTWFRGMRSNKVGPIMVTEVGAGGRMAPVEAPQFGKPGSEQFWKAMIDGARRIVKERGCDDRYLLLGEAFDSRPLQEHVDFFEKIAPETRWHIYSHWIKEPGAKNGKLVAKGGLETGLQLLPNGGGLPEFNRHWPKEKPPERDYYQAQAHRAEFHHTSSPLSYRAFLRGSGTVCRIGLDFWPIFKIRGRTRSYYQSPPNEGWLWRGHTSNLTAPGPRGAVRTVRGQMLMEAMQETEALIVLKRAQQKASPAIAKKIEECLEAREWAAFVGKQLSQATLALDWPGMAAAEYAVAAELAGQRTGEDWSSPPKQ